MATKKNKINKKRKSNARSDQKSTLSNPSTSLNLGFLEDRRFRVSVGLLLITFALTLALSLLSYVFTGKADQSVVESLSFGKLILSGKEAENWLGLAGAGLAHLFIYKWFGIASVLVVPLLLDVGLEMAFRRSFFSVNRAFQIAIFMMFWFSLAMGYYVLLSEEPNNIHFLCGSIGLRVAEVFESLVGWGTVFFLILSMGVFLVYNVRNIPQLRGVKYFFKRLLFGTDKEETSEPEQEDTPEDQPTTTETGLVKLGPQGNGPEPEKGTAISLSTQPSEQQVKASNDNGPEFSVEDTTSYREAVVESSKLGLKDHEAGKQLTIEDGDLYDPTLDLPHYKLPDIELLEDSGSGKVKVSTEELQQNKDRIVETLSNFKIGISSIKATIGPTVTLYEIVPEAGIKISRIKNLEDDIALSLAALGIRIIAPIPGKGTIGIEVPNKNREIVSLKSLLSTEKFQNSKKELPVALGKTISNEVFITDLTKMPHLLMAGATGQGKSVGLNVIISSLLYHKHPSELKFVLIDPKKVELSLFNKIEQHYLACLPDSEEAIITETKKAVGVLKSLCNEMDIRYNLMKEASCRNIKEYNQKFRHRRLNPEKGHRFLPYIVLVMDELADLMMVAGKEIELPIARLAQLARAIGIHMVIATQRPSVDVITGIIKANFPARLSFRVTSKIDSRTILDTGGADQLIGMGDMLLSNSSEIIRLQCAYVDTKEIDKICQFIDAQQGYDTAYLLPEYEDDDNGPNDVDLSQRDNMFEEAARLIVANQQGSTSLIQRKLRIGYNRAGSIVDQLEAAGVVGPSEGSKARQVLMTDEDLEMFLRSLS